MADPPPELVALADSLVARWTEGLARVESLSEEERLRLTAGAASLISQAIVGGVQHGATLPALEAISEVLHAAGHLRAVRESTLGSKQRDFEDSATDGVIKAMDRLDDAMPEEAEARRANEEDYLARLRDELARIEERGPSRLRGKVVVDRGTPPAITQAIAVAFRNCGADVTVEATLETRSLEVPPPSVLVVAFPVMAFLTGFLHRAGADAYDALKGFVKAVAESYGDGPRPRVIDLRGGADEVSILLALDLPDEAFAKLAALLEAQPDLTGVLLRWDSAAGDWSRH